MAILHKAGLLMYRPKLFNVVQLCVQLDCGQTVPRVLICCVVCWVAVPVEREKVSLSIFVETKLKVR